MRTFWTDDQLAKLKELYADHPSGAVAEAVGRSLRSVYHKAQSMGLKKSDAFLASVASGRLRGGVGVSSRFQKGHTPWNQGTSYHAGGRSAETQFKPGQPPNNWLPVGAERITKDGIRQRKITDTGYPPRDWKSVHGLLWEEHHGPVPKGSVVVFINGDKTDIRIENLELVTRKELMVRNSIHKYPEELKALIKTGAKLRRIINKRQSNEK